VVDRRTLVRIFVALNGALGTLGPIIFALKPPAIPSGETACSLSDQQTALIRSAMMDRNATCTYNMTVDAVLGAS
jgi:hypothetical protein